ncbi:UNVERIFIED_ORG: ANTAR domain-containing protein [Bacillus sp. AZ43]
MAETGREPRRGGRSEQSRRPQQPARATGDGSGAHGATDDLAEVMGQLARSLQDLHGDVDATLQQITSTAVLNVPGAEHCTISYVTGRRRVQPRASTGEVPAAVDEAQSRLQEGPCLDSVSEQTTVRIDDMRQESRWPTFAQEAVRLGVLSSLSIQLFVEADNLGALNMYAGAPHAFGEESEDVGLVFAAHAAIAIAGAQQESHLRLAMGSRDLIGQAKGILMERYKVTSDQAFALLSQASQLTNRKLVDIAAELCQTGALPGRSTGSRMTAESVGQPSGQGRPGDR